MKLKDSQTVWAVVPPKAKTLSSALALYDNKDADGLRLYGTSEITLFRQRKAAKEESLVWPGSLIVPVVIRKRRA